MFLSGVISDKVIDSYYTLYIYCTWCVIIMIVVNFTKINCKENDHFSKMHAVALSFGLGSKIYVATSCRDKIPEIILEKHIGT